MANDESQEQQRSHSRGTEEGRIVHFKKLMEISHRKTSEVGAEVPKIQRLYSEVRL